MWRYNSVKRSLQIENLLDFSLTFGHHQGSYSRVLVLLARGTWRVPLHATVSEACLENQWRLPAARSDIALELLAHLTTIDPLNAEARNDRYDWVVAGVTCKVFSSSRTWEDVRPRTATKDWTQLVWFKEGVPKHCFTMWIANLDRLPTRSRLASWGVQTDQSCVCVLHKLRLEITCS